MASVSRNYCVTTKTECDKPALRCRYEAEECSGVWGCDWVKRSINAGGPKEATTFSGEEQFVP